ncbi:hypothetical protein OA2633_08919 [Oceanicaulis sp. HTCC2633]|nr:hypothetical protein OA2633_08919 [Oceanicaulis sp. HTCC2633]
MNLAPKFHFKDYCGVAIIHFWCI